MPWPKVEVFCNSVCSTEEQTRNEVQGKVANISRKNIWNISLFTHIQEWWLGNNVSRFVHLLGNMARKQRFLVCPPLGNMARKQCFLVCPPLGNMARKQCFLVCPPFGKHG